MLMMKQCLTPFTYPSWIESNFLENTEVLTDLRPVFSVVFKEVMNSVCLRYRGYDERSRVCSIVVPLKAEVWIHFLCKVEASIRMYL